MYCERRAFAQGWGVFALDGRLTKQVIQKLDDSNLFQSDAQAESYVQHLAAIGCQNAIAALQLVGITPPMTAP